MKLLNILYLILLQIGMNNIEIRQMINHKWKAVLLASINLPAIHGTVNALIPKHWEYNAIAEPRYSIGEDLIIASEAEGRNMHSAIVRGMKAISINKYPLIRKFERPRKINPTNNEVRHILNL